MPFEVKHNKYQATTSNSHTKTKVALTSPVGTFKKYKIIVIEVGNKKQNCRKATPSFIYKLFKLQHNKKYTIRNILNVLKRFYPAHKDNTKLVLTSQCFQLMRYNIT